AVPASCSKGPLLWLSIQRTAAVRDDARIDVTLNGKLQETIRSQSLPPVGGFIDRGYWLDFAAPVDAGGLCPHETGQVCVRLEVHDPAGALLFSDDQLW